MNILATILDTCPACGNKRLVRPTRTGRVCKKCHNARITKLPKVFKASGPCEYCGAIIVGIHPKQKWCKACCPNASAAARLKHYNLSQPDFEKLKSKQGNLCAICGVNPPSDVDHDHETEEIRDLLCAWCNHGLAYMEDSEWKKKAEIYLRKHSEESGHTMDFKAV